MTQEEKKEKKESVRINFGTSNYCRNAPGVKPEDVAISIPIEGEIEKVGKGEYPSPDLIPEEMLGRIIEDNLIMFRLGQTDEMMAYWIPERGEWIGIVYSSWYESDAWGDDHSARGPYALDDYYARRIRALFKYYDLWLTLEQILHTSPAELKKNPNNK